MWNKKEAVVTNDNYHVIQTYHGKTIARLWLFAVIMAAVCFLTLCLKFTLSGKDTSAHTETVVMVPKGPKGNIVAIPYKVIDRY